jgi:hypothetical protein
MKLYCTHESCRAHAVEELFHAMRALPYRREEFETKAQQIWVCSVPCRHVPRRGPVAVPFAPERVP